MRVEPRLRRHVDKLCGNAKTLRVALETACREIEQTMKKLPTPGDVLPVLKKHSDEWAPRIKVIKAWNDGTIKKMVEETRVALR